MKLPSLLAALAVLVACGREQNAPRTMVAETPPLVRALESAYVVNPPDMKAVEAAISDAAGHGARGKAKALAWAIRNGKTEAQDMMISRDFGVKDVTAMELVAGAPVYPALLEVPIFAAIARNDADLAKRLIDAGADFAFIDSASPRYLDIVVESIVKTSLRGAYNGEDRSSVFLKLFRTVKLSTNDLTLLKFIVGLANANPRLYDNALYTLNYGNVFNLKVAPVLDPADRTAFLAKNDPEAKRLLAMIGVKIPLQ
jgi:hypothetical protein